MQDQKMMSEQKPRWGHRLSRADAEAISRQFVEGHQLTPMQQEERLQQWVEEQLDKEGYAVLNEVRGYMQQHGITRMEADIDHNLLEHTKCEDQCAGQYGHLTGPELDAAFWSCMDQCSPMRRESFDPRHQPASPIEPEKLSNTSLSLPPKKGR
jgi:hypothetical protein